MASDFDISKNRMIVSVFGALAGLSGWVLFEWADSKLTSPHFLVLTLAVVFFGAVLSVVGPLRIGKSILAGVIVALPVALLAFWASLRFLDVSKFLYDGHPILAIFIMSAIPLPFLIAHLRPDQSPTHYEDLFDNAWQIVVRVLGALAFMGIAWAVILLSDTLLKLVGLWVIDYLLEIDPVPPIISGALFGLGVAVLFELSHLVSPQLVLRLVRLLIPLVLVVVIVFIGALPFRGLSGLFDRLSVATVLMAVAFAGVSLVSTALDTSDTAAVQTKGMRMMTQALVLLLPILAVLSVVAVVQRYAQHGWTPTRLSAMTLAVIALFYTVLYAAAVILRGPWMRRIRDANIFMAGFVVVLTALWFTPVLNPQKIAATSQVARLVNGHVSAEDFGYWELTREWGKAGTATAEQLAAMDLPNQSVINTRLAHSQSVTTKYAFNNAVIDDARAETVENLKNTLIVYPVGATLPSSFWSLEPGNRVYAIMRGCQSRTTQAGNPACAAVIGEFDAGTKGKEVIVVFNGYLDSPESFIVKPHPDGTLEYGYNNFWLKLSKADLDQFVDQGPVFGSVSLDSLSIGANRIFPYN